jgi:hypothetical protein
MNPSLIEMMAKDRSAELRAAAANRPSRSAVGSGVATRRPASFRPSPRVGLANPQRAVGWFLVSVGLRLAMPRTPTRTAR